VKTSTDPENKLSDLKLRWPQSLHPKLLLLSYWLQVLDGRFNWSRNFSISLSLALIFLAHLEMFRAKLLEKHRRVSRNCHSKLFTIARLHVFKYRQIAIAPKYYLV